MPVIGAVAGLAGGILANKGAKSAANTQAKSADAASAEQQRQFDTINQQQAPYRQAGEQALNQLMWLYGLNGQPADYSGFENSPDYQFALQQGQQATERSAASRGMLNSGNTLAAAQQYGQGLASQQLGNYRNSLMGILGSGQNAANFTGQAGFNTGQAIGQNIQNAGNARASGTLAGTNALIGGLGGLAQGAQDYFSNRGAPVQQAPQPWGGIQGLNDPFRTQQRPQPYGTPPYYPGP